VIPNRRGEDLVFSTSFTYDGATLAAAQRQRKEGIDELDIVGNLYTTMVIEFNKVIKQLDIGYEDNNKKRHIFTLHSCRRYVRTLLSDLGYQDFGEWILGHQLSTYWGKSDKEKYALFKKLEPYLILLDQSTLQRQGSDLQTKLETMERENQTLRQKDSMNSDAIAGLSDKMQELMAKVRELEKN
jgi:hypothetical protein